MKPIREVLDTIVAKNIKLPAFIWFKHSLTDRNDHHGSITSVYDNTVVINYLEGTKQSCQHKMFISVNHTAIVAELDEEEAYTHG